MKPAVGAVLSLVRTGVDGDAHAARSSSTAPEWPGIRTSGYLRQVPALRREMLDAFTGRGSDVGSGELCENVTAEGFDVFDLHRPPSRVTPTSASNVLRYGGA